MTQHERIIKMLHDGPMCGSTFLAAFMPTYSQRIGELNLKGYRIYRVECPYDEHAHQSGIATYELSKHQGGTYDDVAPASLFDSQVVPTLEAYDESQDGDAYLAEQREQEPEREPPGDDVEDGFHTMVVWHDTETAPMPDDEADFGHDSATDQALGEGIG